MEATETPITEEETEAEAHLQRAVETEEEMREEDLQARIAEVAEGQRVEVDEIN